MPRLVTLAGVTALAAALLGSSLACGPQRCEVHDGPTSPRDLGTDEDLHALAAIDPYDERDPYSKSYLAVGAEGRVVVFAPDFVELHELDTADLRGAWAYQSTWWVVGDAGAIATTDNFGASWEMVELPGVDVDLHAVDAFAGRPLIVGDEIVLHRRADGSWARPEAPGGSWGALRDVATLRGREGDVAYAVGLDGTLWTSSDPAKLWVAEELGVDHDLLAVGRGLSPTIVGAEGTLLRFVASWIEGAGWAEDEGWVSVDTGLSVDLIDWSRGWALSADGGVYELRGDSLVRVDEYPGARALVVPERPALVGLGGLAALPQDLDCL